MRVTMIGRCGAFPVAGEATTGFLIETNEGSVLVDCGSGVVERLQRFLPIQHLDAVLISHYHHDHVADLGVLEYSALVTTRQGLRAKPLHVYAPKQPSEQFARWRLEPFCELHPTAPDTQLELLGLSVRFMSTRHPVPCMAMSFSDGQHRVCFTADTSYIPELVPFAEGADLLIAEASFYRHEDGTATGHLTSWESGQLAEDAAVKQLIVSHLPSHGELSQLVAEVREKFSGPVQLSRTGLVVEL